MAFWIWNIMKSWTSYGVNTGRTDDPDPHTGITSRDKYLIRTSWEIVMKDPTGNGVKLFMRLFEIQPEHKQAFPFRNILTADLPTNKRFQAHCNSIVYSFGSIVSGMDDHELLNSITEKIGVSHAQRSVDRQALKIEQTGSFKVESDESPLALVLKKLSINVHVMKHDLEEVLYISSDSTQPLKPVKKTKKSNDTLFLYFSAFTANLIMFSGATDMVWTTPVIPKLESNDTSINPLGRPITYYETSILAGLSPFTSILGGIVFMKLPDAIGRRKFLMYMTVGMLLSDVTVGSFGNIYLYYVARSMFSLFLGAVFVVLPVYLSEISEDHNRVKYGCLMMVAIPAGNLYSYIIGTLTSISKFTYLCVAPLIPCLLSFLFVVPETPFYLATRHDRKGAISVLKKLRSNKTVEEIEADYDEIEREIRARAYLPKLGYSCLFETRSLKRALLIACGVNLAQHCSGVMAIMSFLSTIPNEAGTNLSGTAVFILVCCVKISLFTITSFSVENLGRRPLLLFSCTCSAIPLFILGLCFYWQSYDNSIISDYQWLPIACILTFVVVYAVGLGPIPSALISDLFPNDVLSVAISFVSTVVMIAIFMILSVFPIAVKYLGMHYCLWVFSMNCLLFSCFMYFMLPETKGRSILEIQNKLGE